MKLTAFAGCALLTSALFSCSSKSTFTINGTVSDDIKDTAYFVYLGKEDLSFNQTPDDTIYVKDKHFSYTCEADKPCLINLQAIFEDGKVCSAYVDFILVPGEVADLTVCNGYFKLTGSKFYQEWREMDDRYTKYIEEMQELTMVIRAMDRSDTVAFEAKVQEYNDKSNEYMMSVKGTKKEGVAVISTMFLNLPMDVVFDDLNADIRNGRFKAMFDTTKVHIEKEEEEYTKRAEASVAAKERTAVGKMFVDFEAEYNGKVQKLSDYVGKGKYILVDFWASWCGPCRAEIPNLINIWKEYKDSNFDVVGIASSDDPKDTERAIEELGIEYPQILNAQRAGTEPYGILGIPTIILFGPDGTILARDIRGEEIGEAVAANVKK